MRATPHFVSAEAKYRLQGTGLSNGLISSTVPGSAFIGYLQHFLLLWSTVSKNKI
jgi:hypothetical protein